MALYEISMTTSSKRHPAGHPPRHTRRLAVDCRPRGIPAPIQARLVGRRDDARAAEDSPRLAGRGGQRKVLRPPSRDRLVYHLLGFFC